MIFSFKLLDLPRVIDADTFSVKIDLGFTIYTSRDVRLSGVDAPETHGAVEQREKAAGVKAAKIAGDWLAKHFGKHLELQSEKIDSSEKYGRILGDFIFHSDSKHLITLTGHLLENKLVRPYSGGKKLPWTAAELKVIEDFGG